VFAYCAAHLASGIITFEQVGPAYPSGEAVVFPIHEPTQHEGEISGIFEINDPNFGNIWTNIPLEMFIKAGFAYGDTPMVTILNNDRTIFESRVLFEKSFGFAEKGDVIIYNNELSNIAMAVCQGNLCERYGLGYGADWVVSFKA